MSACRKCNGTGRTRWCSSDKKIMGPCPMCQPRSNVARAVANHRARIWGGLEHVVWQHEKPARSPRAGART